MSEFEFIIRCHPKSDFRAREIKQFLNLMQKAFSVTAWLESSMVRPTVNKREEIEKLLADRLSKKSYKKGPVHWSIFSSVSEGMIWIRIDTGSSIELFKDSYVVDCKRIQRLPDLSFFSNRSAGVE